LLGHGGKWGEERLNTPNCTGPTHRGRTNCRGGATFSGGRADMRSSFGRIDDKMMNVSPETNEREAPGSLVCVRCGASFRCGILAGDAACWCAALPALPLDRLRPDMSCLCPACLAEEIGHATALD